MALVAQVFNFKQISMSLSIRARPPENKSVTYALRLMALLAVNEGLLEVDEQTVRRAISLCDWQLQVRQFYDPIDADNSIAKMEEKIRRQLVLGPKKERQLQQNVNARRSGLWHFNTAKSNLTAANVICLDRKTQCWKLCLEEGV